MLYLKDPTEFRDFIALSVLLWGGPPNSLEDGETCYQCGKDTVDKDKKLTKAKKDTWVKTLFTI